MRKYLNLVLCALAALSLSALTACFTPGNYEKTFPELVEHFARNGIKVSAVTGLVTNLAQAESAFAFRIGDREVGIYKYNFERKKQLHRYRLVEDSGVLYINGKKFKALRNGCFVMIDYDTHPEQEKIVKAFESF